MPRFVLLSGPSCIGKSPLRRALGRCFPEVADALRAPVLYNSRVPRPGEQDGVEYRFRSREHMEGLRGKEGYLVMDVRRDIQALDMADVRAVLDSGSDALFEGNPYVATALMEAPELRGVPLVTIFLSPLSAEEIGYLQQEAPSDAERIVADVMRRKLLRRATKQRGLLSLVELEDIEARCGAAYRELGYAWRFDHVIPNHDGEDSENWDAFGLPLGDARKCLLDFVAIVRGEKPRFAEKWERELFDG